MAPHLGIPSSDVCEAPTSVPQSQQQSVKSRKVKQKKNSKNSSAIKMCNTKTENNNSGISQFPVTNTQCYETERVPPLPTLAQDILLAKAVESLNITNQNQSRQLQKRRNKKKQCVPAENLINSKSISVENKDFLIHPVNPILCASGNSETPSRQIPDISSPQQCGACGLEFSSVESLSQHLLKHVYEGMYAAQWLTQAMTLVSQHQEQATQPMTTQVSQHQGQTSQAMTHATQYQEQTSPMPRQQQQQHDMSSILPQEQCASILQQQSLVSIPQQQDQYASIVLQQASTQQQPLQLQDVALQPQISSHKPLQLQETAPTIYTQAPLCTSTVHPKPACAQEAKLTKKINSLEKCKNIEKSKSVVETDSTAVTSPLIQDQNSLKLSSTKKLSNHAIKSQC